jgi:hypothetical protein
MKPILKRKLSLFLTFIYLFSLVSIGFADDSFKNSPPKIEHGSLTLQKGSKTAQENTDKSTKEKKEEKPKYTTKNEISDVLSEYQTIVDQIQAPVKEAKNNLKTAQEELKNAQEAGGGDVEKAQEELKTAQEALEKAQKTAEEKYKEQKNVIENAKKKVDEALKGFAKLNDDEKKEILEIITESDIFVELCSRGSAACVQVINSDKFQKNFDDEEKRQALFQELAKQEAISEEDILNCAAEGQCSYSDLQGFSEGQCTSSICSLFYALDAEDEYRDALEEQIRASNQNTKKDKINEEDNKLTGTVDIPNVLCKDEKQCEELSQYCSKNKNSNECYQALSDACNKLNDESKQQQCNDQALDNVYDSLSQKATAEDYNNRMVKDICSKNSKVCSSIEECKGNSPNYNTCKTKLKEECQKNPNSGACQIAKELEDNEYVTYSEGFLAFLAFLQPDQKAIQAAELFGFESDYSKVPAWLQVDTASQICLGKIEGYFKPFKESVRENTDNGVTSSGTTQYRNCGDPYLQGYDSQGGQLRNPQFPCVDVQGDIRGQRGPFLPNGQIGVDYSYYIKNYAQENVSFSVAFLYEYKGEKQLDYVYEEKFKTLAPNEEDSDAKFIYLPNNNQFDETLESFEEEPKIIAVTLIGVYRETGEKYIHLVAEVPEITADSYENVLGQNPVGEEQSSQDSFSENEVIDAIENLAGI